MTKRLLCALLTVMMLVSLVPATALTASAAGISTSESAITVLKQWEGYSKNCVNGYTGYGTKCTKEGDHSTHVTTEAQADAALRAELKELDSAINTFASKNGLALTQNKHDALVLFSFENGTAWTTGTGDFKSAVTSRARGSEFLNAICWWDSSTADDNRRMVEANMYLNGVYSTAVPSNFIRVEYNANGGQLAEAKYRYYDTTTNPKPDVVPTRAHHTFMGWYSDPEEGHQVTSLTRSRTLYAYWQPFSAEPDNGDTTVFYIKEFANQTALYNTPGGDKLDYTVKGNVTIDKEFIDSVGMRWGRVSHTQKFYHKGTKVEEDVTFPTKMTIGGKTVTQYAWMQLGKIDSQGVSSSSGTKYSMDLTVTVTNAYVRVRAEDSIYSKELRRANKGDQLRIVNTSSNDGFLWGQIADSNGDGVCEGWVALLYTNYESVKNQGGSSSSTYKVIGTATIIKPVDGYVNLRSGAGTDKQIVGALPYQTRVNLYEIQYVNGMRWGRTDSGWFSLAYAEVEGVNVDDYVNDANVLAYAFVGNILTTWDIHVAPNDDAEVIRVKTDFKTENRTITHLTADDAGNTWGKIAEGWVKVSDSEGNAQNVKLQPARYFTVESGVAVRKSYSNDAERVNNLTKGVEFIVNNPTQVVVKGDTIWGFAEKFGETKPTYSGWVNLASKHVSRTDPASAEKGESGSHSTGKMATIVNTDNVNVREYNDTTYKKIGSLGRGVTVAVWEEEDGWYKVDSNRNGVYDYEGDGWVSGKYLNIFTPSSDSGSSGSTGGSSGSSTGSSSETGLGIIANTYTGVNVRTGAGTGYPAKGKILAGSSVEILEVKTAGASKWGRVAQGWICMDYVTMVSYYPVTDPSGSTGGNTGSNTGNSGSSNTTSSTAVILTGTVKAFAGTINEAFPETGRDDAGNLIVYKTPDVKADAVRTLQNAAPVTIHELLTVEEKMDKDSDEQKGNDITISGSVKIVRHWARINDGYVLRPGDNLALDTLDEITYTVTGVKGEDTLNVRADRTGTDSEIIDKLHEYDTVTVTSLTILKSEIWGRVEYVNKDGKEITGWVNMSYMTRGVVTKPAENNNNNNNNNNNGNTGSSVVIGSGGNTGNHGSDGFVNNSSGYRYTGKVIRTSSVNVRALPSQTAQLTTTLKGGASLVIYETTTAEGMAWGRCDAGWVYLYYVDLTPCNTAVDAKVVYNENTIAYTDANCTAVAGTYSRMAVVDIYEQVGDMCRTELGWVHVDNLG